MKRKLTKIFGVSLTLVMVLSLMVAFAPVATAADYEENEWGEWGLPDVEEYTDIGPMAIAPDGTIFAAVYNWDEDIWYVQMSDDGGFSWDDTDMDDIGDAVAQIVVSPNYEEDETVYVGLSDARVFRLEEAGDDAKELKTITDTDSTDASVLHSIDAFYSEDLGYNLVLVGTDVDVLLLEDMVTGFWIDQELDAPAYEVNFAPDFEDEELIWAITDDGTDFVITSTISPGLWGQEIGDNSCN